MSPLLSTPKLIALGICILAMCCAVLVWDCINQLFSSKPKSKQPKRWGTYWLHPDGWYRLFPPKHS
ncbi:MAG: hypothetical protein WC378_14685 [Opitutaceae bacterium]|jgi:hypothetical protein